MIGIAVLQLALVPTPEEATGSHVTVVELNILNPLQSVKIVKKFEIKSCMVYKYKS